MTKQLTHTEINNEGKQFPITIVCDAIRTPENIGMCFRIAESFGVKKIYFHENSPTLENRIVKKTARNTVHIVEHEVYADFAEIIQRLKREENTIIGIEITDQSVKLQDFKFNDHKNIVLILGSERHGIHEIQLADHTVSIPMFGKNSSMNVVHSLAITLYEITNQLSQ
jgi:23S rRNA (guanosine2251-2'-O)-methyltransferase